jgi:zinc transport system ATP-binding protein
MAGRQVLSKAGNGARGPSITFEGVSLSYGNTQVLSNLNLTIDPGTVHAFVGPNGGGKTSTIKSLLGETPHSGCIAISWSESRIVGYVPQSLDFDHNLPITVDDLMAILCQDRPAFLGAKKSVRDEFILVLDRIGMGHKRDRLMGELSGGERQRVMLAQALLPIPDLLILDEPTSGMDKPGAEIFGRIIRELRAEGVTIVWVHHNLREVREIADRVTCINRCALFSGEPSEVLTEQRILDVFSTQPTTRSLP